MFELQRMEGSWQEATVSATGRLPAQLLGAYLPRVYLQTLAPTAVPARLDARIESLTLSALAPLMNGAAASDIDGQLSVSAGIEADALTLDHMRGEVRFDRADLMVGGLPISQQRPTRITLDQGRARIVDWRWAGAGSTIEIGGSADLSAVPALNLSADAVLDLRLLGGFLPGMSTGGRAQVAVRLSGTTRQPQVDGRIDLTGGELRQASPRVAVTGLAGGIVLDGDRIYSPTQLTGVANGGTVAVNVDLRLPSLSAVRGAISLEGRGLASDVPAGLRSEVDADLALRMSEDGLALTGTVDVLRASYRDPLSVTSGLLQTLQQTTPIVTQSPSRLDAMTLGIRVTTREDVHVDNNYAQLALGADLRLVGTLGQPGLLGRASPREGGQIFLGANVYRLSGTESIDFANPGRIEPDLNLSAVTRVRNYDVTLAITGTPADLQTDLTSDPPLDRTDLVSMLVTGQTIAERGGRAFLGTEQVLGILSGEVLSTTGRAVGLDVLRVERGSPEAQFDSGLVATETDPTSRLTFGKRVTSNTEVIFSQSLRQSGGLTWIVSYTPRRNIEIRVVSDDNNNRTYDFRHDVSFGGLSAAQEDRPAARPRVAAVEFEGNAGVEAADLSREVKLSAGDRFDFFTWQDDRDRLADILHRRGYFEARVEADRASNDSAGGAVTLTYHIDRGPRTIVEVMGDRVSDSTRRALEDEWTHSVFDEFLIDRAKTIVRAQLAADGYLTATVDASVQSSANGDEKRLVIAVKPGERVARRRIEFRGNARLTTGRLDALVDDRNLESTAWNDPAPLRDAVLSLYRDQGMLAASVVVGQPVFADEGATLPVDITEGPLFRIGAVTIEGAEHRSEDQVRAWLELMPDEVYRAGVADAARRRLESAYRQQGFNAVSIDLMATRPPDGDRVALAVRVNERSQDILRDIRVDGAERTRQTLVAKILKLDVGAPVDLTAWQEARRRLYDAGVFRRVQIDEEPIVPNAAAAQPESGPGAAVERPVRARVSLEEWPPLRLRYGFSVSDEETTSSDSRAFRPGLSGDLTYRNVFGLAAATGVAARYTKDFRAARWFVTVPTLFGTPIVSNVFVSRSREAISEAGARPFVTDKLDVTAEQRIRPARRLEFTYSVQLRAQSHLRHLCRSVDHGELRSDGQRRAPCGDRSIRFAQRSDRRHCRLVSLVEPRVRPGSPRFGCALREVPAAAGLLPDDRSATCRRVGREVRPRHRVWAGPDPE